LKTHFHSSLMLAVLAAAVLVLASCGGGGASSTPPASYSLSVTVSGNGSVTATGFSCGSTCSQSFASGASVTLTATPGSGYTFSGWGGDCAGSAGTCTLTMTAARTVAASFTATVSNMPVGVFTDLASAPIGAFVTVYGIDSATSSWPVILHGNNKTVVQVPDATTALTVNGQAIPVSVHSGRVLLATTGTIGSLFDAIAPGDVIYLRAGTYTGHYGATYWNESNFILFTAGTASQPMALVAYPGEFVMIDNSGAGGNNRPNFYLGNSGAGLKGSYFTIAGFNLIAQADTIAGGGNTADSSTPESGAAYARVVGCTHTIVDAISNTMTGIVSIQGDGWKVFGNTFYDASNRTIINNNHGIYVQNGADDVEIAYNALIDLRMGHTIQVHQDGTPMLYTNIWVHDNLVQSADSADARGITVSNVDTASTVKIERNTLRRVGQNFSAVSVYRGVVEVRDNIFEDILGPAIDANGNGGGTRTIYESGNTFTNVGGGNFSASNGASLTDIVHQ